MSVGTDPPEGQRDLKVLYVAGKRGVESACLLLRPHLRLYDTQVTFVAGPAAYLRALGRCVWLLLRSRPDVALVETPGSSSILPCFLLKVMRVPFVLRVKGDLWAERKDYAYPGAPLWRSIKRRIDFSAFRWQARYARMVLPIASHIERRCRAEGIAGPIETVGITYSPGPETARSEAPKRVSAEETFFLTVMNFRFGAKVRPLMEAVGPLVAALTDSGCRWTVLGDGPYLDAFRRTVERQDPAGLVRVVGFTDPRPYYQRALALVYFSGLDGLPGVLLDAAWHGLPLVVNADAPMAAAVRDELGALLVDREEPDALCSILGRIARSPGWRRELGGRAHAAVTARFSAERIGGLLQDALVRSAVESDAARPAPAAITERSANGSTFHCRPDVPGRRTRTHLRRPDRTPFL